MIQEICHHLGPNGGGNNYGNDDNIIDLNEDEYTIRDADRPQMPVFGLPMYDNNNDHTNINNPNDIRYQNPTRDSNMNGNNLGHPIRYANMNGQDEDYQRYGDIGGPSSSQVPPQTPPPHTGGSGNVPPPQTPPPVSTQRDNDRSRPQDSEKPTRKQRILRAAKVGGRRLASQAGRGIVRGATGAVLNAPNTAAKLAVGALVGGTAAVVAGAAGIASGDMKNVATYGGAALGAGAMAGSGMVNGAKNRFDGALSGAAQAMKQAYYEEDEYKQKQVEKQNKQWKKDLKNREYLERAVGIDKAKEMYKNGDIDEYLKYGIKDAKEMATIQKLQDEGIARDRQHAMAIHDYAERTGDTTKMKKKDRDEWKSTYENEFKDRGHADDRAKTLSEDTLGYVDKYNKLKNKL